MKEQEKLFDIEKIIINLQRLGESFKRAIFRLPNSLPDSAIKEYLLLETSKIIEFKTATDFYYLHNKISRMMDMVIRWNLDGELLKLLEDMSMETKKIVLYVERERED